MFASEIRSIYTQMLTSSILPFLNRERPDIAEVLTEYQGELYDDGQFSYQLMLQSARSMEADIPPAYIDEMQGIADGADLPYEEILVLNTFVDSMLTLRSITFFIRRLEAPYVAWIAFDGGLDDDGVDNDGDGEIDEEGEEILSPFEPNPRASFVEVPTDTTIRWLLVDQAGANDALGLDSSREPEGVDPESVRIQLDTEVIEASDPRLTTRAVTVDDLEGVEVTFDPGGLEPGVAISLLLQSGDESWVTDPPPAHARFMRDERIVFTTEGFGATPREVESRGERDGRTLPPSIGFAARGSATASGRPLMAHHYTLLDANTSHKHTALFVHHTDEGQDHVVLGWTGMVWGFSGMNDQGLSYGAFSSDTLDNGMIEEMLNNIVDISQARLVASGVPIGIMGRSILNETSTVDEATAWLESHQRSFGWNILLADAEGGMQAVEMDADVLGFGGFASYSVSDDPTEPWAVASVGPDDLRLACHYLRNTEDMSFMFLRPQRYWSSFYYRSMRAHYILGERIAERSGDLDVAGMIAIMRDPDLVDPRDSMSAVVFENADRRLHVAMGVMPATDGEFMPFDLDDFFGGGGR